MGNFRSKDKKEYGSWPISRVLSRTIIHLRYLSPNTFSDLPKSFCGSQNTDFYLVLLRVGFTLPQTLPLARCALTAPFQPYLKRRYIFCCTFRRLAPPRRYLALNPMEPGLSSSFQKRLSSQLPGREYQLFNSILKVKSLF